MMTLVLRLALRYNAYLLAWYGHLLNLHTPS